MCPSALDAPTVEDLLDRLQAVAIVLAVLGVQPSPRVPRHPSIRIEVASNVVEAFLASDKAHAVELDGEELGCRFQDPEVARSALPVDPTSMSEDTEDRLKGLKPRPLRLTVAMRSMGIASGRVAQGSLEVGFQMRRASHEEFGV